uniref:Uncharacterized protein n=1 Tax=viral metagenome TaxID=1070528 RepID=A0A6C0JWE8_9ZZZZ
MFFQIVIVLVLILLISKSMNRTGPSVIEKLVKKTAKYATMAQQDDSPMLAIMHANYSMAYLEALLDMASYRDINRVTNIDVKLFVEHIVSVQRTVTKKVVQKIPALQGEIDLYLSAIAGNV